MAEQNVFNLMQNDEIGLLWKKIYQLHQKTKIYLLTAEEISENGDALIQPLKEHRDAYDHIVRIFASTTKKVPEGYDYVVMMCFASALYFTADMGVSAYDAYALILDKRTPSPLIKDIVG